MLKKIRENSILLYVVSDQTIVSLGNFLISVLILRYIGIQEFGIFAFILLNVYFLNDIQLSGIISPMLTNGPKQNQKVISYFYGSIFILQIIFSFFCSIFFYLILNNFGFLIPEFKLSNYAFTLLFLIFFSQLNQFLKRLVISKEKFIRPIFSDFFTYVFFFITFFFFYGEQNVNLDKVFLILTISFFIGSLCNISSIFSLNFKLENFISTTKKNWVLSKWLVLTSVTGWFSRNLWIISVGAILGPYIFGIVRSCQIILNFKNVFLQSLENIFPATTSKIYINEGKINMKNYINQLLIKGLIVSFVLILIVIFFSQFILELIYGIEVAEYSWILMILAIIIPIEYIKYPPTYALRTIEKTKPIFISLLISSIFALIAARPIIQNFEINGLLFGLIFTELLSSIVIYTSFLYFVNKKN